MERELLREVEPGWGLLVVSVQLQLELLQVLGSVLEVRHSSMLELEQHSDTKSRVNHQQNMNTQNTEIHKKGRKYEFHRKTRNINGFSLEGR